jgi:PAS domain S-box-containing protein
MLELRADPVDVTVRATLATDPFGRVVAPQPSWERLTGQSWEACRGYGWLDAMHPDDRHALAACRAIGGAARPPAHEEARLRCADGVERWFLCLHRPTHDERGELSGWLSVLRDGAGRGRELAGTPADIGELLETRRRLRETEGEVRHLAGRLLAAQEEERRRVARELHDDLSQQVAVVALELCALERLLPDGAGGDEALRRVRELRRRSADLARHVRQLSRELHPAVLEHVGLAAALRAHVEELARQGVLEVELEADELPPTLGPATALCLYRVAQEALRNVHRHAGVRRARVELAAAGGVARLVVRDHGRGFDPAARGGAGMGLLSMAERARPLGGVARVRSAWGAGTTITVELPLEQPDAPA